MPFVLAVIVKVVAKISVGASTGSVQASWVGPVSGKAGVQERPPDTAVTCPPAGMSKRSVFAGVGTGPLFSTVTE